MTTLSSFEKSAIIGLWRMGNDESVIANTLGLDHKEVNKVIKAKTFIEEMKLKPHDRRTAIHR